MAEDTRPAKITLKNNRSTGYSSKSFPVCVFTEKQKYTQAYKDTHYGRLQSLFFSKSIWGKRRQKEHDKNNSHVSTSSCHNHNAGSQSPPEMRCKTSVRLRKAKITQNKKLEYLKHGKFTGKTTASLA